MIIELTLEYRLHGVVDHTLSDGCLTLATSKTSSNDIDIITCNQSTSQNLVLFFLSKQWAKHRQQRIWASAGKCLHKWTFVLNLFSTELPFTRGSFTASVRDHNLREASHLYYEGKE
jgi:hypothetical protein